MIKRIISDDVFNEFKRIVTKIRQLKQQKMNTKHVIIETKMPEVIYYYDYIKFMCKIDKLEIKESL